MSSRILGMFLLSALQEKNGICTKQRYKKVLEGRENAFQWEISFELIKKKVKPV